MKRYYIAAAALLGLTVIVGSTEVAWSRPLPAHHAVPSFSPGVCLASGAWKATLTITTDTPGGTAHLQPEGVVGFDLAVPGSYTVQAIPGNRATYTVHTTVSWPDGFSLPLPDVTATRPADGCTVPTTSTTDCAHANPPIADCGGTTSTTGSVTTTPTSSTTATAPSATTAPAATSTSPPVSVSSGNTTTPSTICTPTGQPIGPDSNVCGLPTTGSSDTSLVFAAVVVALIGCALIVGARRRGTEG